MSLASISLTCLYLAIGGYTSSLFFFFLKKSRLTELLFITGFIFHTISQISRGWFIGIFTPSLIHICFLIILSGHLLSMISGFNLSIYVMPEKKISLLLQTNIRVLDQNCDYYNSPELLKGFVKQCTVSLELEAQGKKTLKQISFIEPLFWQGYSFHLLMDKKTDTPKIKLIIKNDPGVRLILSGFTILVLLMVWYFTQLYKVNKGG